MVTGLTVGGNDATGRGYITNDTYVRHDVGTSAKTNLNYGKSQQVDTVSGTGATPDRSYGLIRIELPTSPYPNADLEITNVELFLKCETAGTEAVCLRHMPGGLAWVEGYGNDTVPESAFNVNYSGAAANAWVIITHTAGDAVTFRIDTGGVEDYPATGSRDLTNASYDTIAELVADITAFSANYTATQICGSTGGDPTDPNSVPTANLKAYASGVLDAKGGVIVKFDSAKPAVLGCSWLDLDEVNDVGQWAGGTGVLDNSTDWGWGANGIIRPLLMGTADVWFEFDLKHFADKEELEFGDTLNFMWAYVEMNAVADTTAFYSRSNATAANRPYVTITYKWPEPDPCTLKIMPYTLTDDDGNEVGDPRLAQFEMDDLDGGVSYVKIFRHTSAGVTTGHTLVTTNKGSTIYDYEFDEESPLYETTAQTEDTPYYYKAFVYHDETTAGSAAGSNEVTFLRPDNNSFTVCATADNGTGTNIDVREEVYASFGFEGTELTQNQDFHNKEKFYINWGDGGEGIFDFKGTLLSAQEASGQTVLSVDDATVFSVGDKVVLPSNTVPHYSTVTAIDLTPSANTITIADALTSTYSANYPIQVANNFLHRYTESGTFTPYIQGINDQGFWSDAAAANTNPAPPQKIGGSTSNTVCLVRASSISGITTDTFRFSATQSYSLDSSDPIDKYQYDIDGGGYTATGNSGADPYIDRTGTQLGGAGGPYTLSMQVSNDGGTTWSTADSVTVTVTTESTIDFNYGGDLTDGYTVENVTSPVKIISVGGIDVNEVYSVGVGLTTVTLTCPNCFTGASGNPDNVPDDVNTIITAIAGDYTAQLDIEDGSGKTTQSGRITNFSRNRTDRNGLVWQYTVTLTLEP